MLKMHTDNSLSPRTLQALAKEALQVQDACNLLGVSKGFAKAVQEVWENMKAVEEQTKNSETQVVKYASMDDLRQHPIVLLWVDKIYSMTVMIGQPSMNKAYSNCHKLAEGESCTSTS